MSEPQEPPVEITLASWAEALALLVGPVCQGWIFRGQECYDWPLLSNLARLLQAAAPPGAILRDWENSAIGFFKTQASAHLRAVPHDHDLLGWLSLMQHYRAPTRLLDWSESPFVAIYFAYATPRDDDSVLWMLEPYYCARMHLGSLVPLAWDHLGTMGHSASDSQGNAVTTYPALERTFTDVQNQRIRRAIRHEAKWPLPLIPTWPDVRMSAQQAVFTTVGDLMTPIDHLMSKEKWTDKVYEPGMMIVGTDSTVWPLNWPGQVIRKLRLPSAWRTEALESLRRMGISPASMFPGIDGVGDATRQRLLASARPIADSLTGLGEF